MLKPVPTALLIKFFKTTIGVDNIDELDIIHVEEGRRHSCDDLWQMTHMYFLQVEAEIFNSKQWITQTLNAMRTRFLYNTFSIDGQVQFPTQIVHKLVVTWRIMMVVNQFILIIGFLFMILSHLFASSLQVQQLHLACQQHPCACPIWQEPLIACRRP